MTLPYIGQFLLEVGQWIWIAWFRCFFH